MADQTPNNFTMRDGMNKVFNNTPFTYLASAARTATPTKTDNVNYGYRGAVVVIDLTAFVTAASLTVTIQGKDPLSAKYYTILVSAAITSVSTTLLTVYPALTAATNSVANAVLPRHWAIDCVHGNANSTTYSVGVLPIL
jgi:hypothetical protein